MKREPVVFVHVPKTAGATLTAVMRSEYGRIHRVGDRSLPEELELARRAEEEGARAFAGHMPYGLAERLRGSYAYVTLLRDPVARIASHYGWVRRHPESPLYPALASSRMTLAEYARNHPLAPLFNNGQVRLLGGWAGGERPADRRTLEAAQLNLERFAVAGTVERFEDALDAMRRRLGWGAGTYEQLNTASPEHGGAELDEATREVLEDSNALDVELYRSAARFQREAIRA
jgi:hypothetical protein